MRPHIYKQLIFDKGAETIAQGQYFNKRWDNFVAAQSLSRVRLCDPMNRSMPGFPVSHCLRVCSHSCLLSQ